jgi:Fe-S cluster biogenesis protein NfuA
VSSEELKGVLCGVAAALVERDGGALYLLPLDESRAAPVVRLHLGGSFSGCPGNALVRDYVLGPLVAAVSPRARLEVTSGALIPPGAERLRPNSSPATPD